MKKHSLIFALFIFIALACSPGNKGEQGSTNTEKMSIDPNKTYTLKEAALFEGITVSAQGLGTYKQLDVVLENSSESKITIIIPAGSHFQNPIDAEQSLISSQLKENQITVKKLSAMAKLFNVMGMAPPVTDVN